MLLAQTELSRAKQSDVPIFHYAIAKHASHKDISQGKIDISIKIAYDELQFTKTDLGFTATYEVTTVVYDKDGNQVDGIIWQKEVNAPDYITTNSRSEYSFSNSSFELEPGEYKLSIGLTDLDSKKTAKKEESIKLQNYGDAKVAISDIMFARLITTDSSGAITIIPDVTDATMGIGNELYVYYEIYNNQSLDSVKVSYNIINPRKKSIFSKSFFLQTAEYYTPHYEQIDIDSLAFGKYLMEIEVEGANESDKTEKMFNVRWVGLPTTVTDLEMAIEQLRYIAEKSDFNKIKKAKEEDKLEEFKKFWRQRDPTPGTVVNEAADEHYRRVQYANETFTIFREGWKTDMGMIYIILGTPDEVNRNPYPLEDKPYEIWYYYKINRDFIFYDERGFGEYRLVNLYSLEELIRLRY
jgi:GWxTD domain-containing protein